MTKTQVYLPEEDLAELHRVAKRTGRSVAALIREAVQAAWIRRRARGPIALWDGEVERSSLEHDEIYDEP